MHNSKTILSPVRLLVVPQGMILSHGCRKAKGIMWRLVSGGWVNLNRGRVFAFILCLAQGSQSRGHAKRHHYPLIMIVKFTSVAQMGLEQKREARRR